MCFRLTFYLNLYILSIYSMDVIRKGGIVLTGLAERLKYFRKKSNLTQQQVADALGMNRSTYAYYETGTTRPKINTLQSLARLYNTNVDLLLDSAVSGEDEVLNSPDKFEKWYMDDKFNQLSDFEQAILLRVRLMDVNEKKKLMEYLDKFFDNEQ